MNAERSGGRGMRWVWAVGFVLLCGSGGAVGVLFGVEPFTGRYWLVYGLYLVVGLAFGVGMGLLLRRSLGWRDSAWASRRHELSWRQRFRLGWAAERARAVDDPELARAAVERGEFGLRAMARLGESYLLVARILSVLCLLMAAALAFFVVRDAVHGEAPDVAIVAIVVVLAGFGVVLPWLHRRLWRWATRRAERGLEANREVAVRGGTLPEL